MIKCPFCFKHAIEMDDVVHCVMFYSEVADVLKYSMLYFIMAMKICSKKCITYGNKYYICNPMLFEKYSIIIFLLKALSIIVHFILF